MEQILGWTRDLPTAALIAVLALVAVQLSLQVYSLIDLARRNAVLYERKWIWVLVILLGNLLGAIVYLVLGRKPLQAHAEEVEPPDAGNRKEKVDRTIDMLYGNEDER